MSTAENEKELHKLRNYNSPQNAVMPLDKVSTNFFGSGNMGSPEEVLERMKMEEDNIKKTGVSDIRIRVSAKNEPEVAVKNCYIAVTDEIDKIAGVEISHKLTQDEMIVFSAVCSIIDAGNMAFTPKQIYAAMTGRKAEKINNSDPMIHSIELIMLRLMCTIVSLDWTDQAKEWKIDGQDIKSFHIKGNLIYAKRVQLQLWNGAMVAGYTVKEVPDLFKYIKAIKQYAFVKREILNIDIKMTNRNIRIRNYIIKKVEQIKNNKRKRNQTNDCFRFDTMIKMCQLEVNNNRAMKDIRDATYSILVCYVEMGYIKNYEKNIGKNGRTVESVRIIV